MKNPATELEEVVESASADTTVQAHVLATPDLFIILKACRRSRTIFRDENFENYQRGEWVE